jgi:hypothetical protein
MEIKTGSTLFTKGEFWFGGEAMQHIVMISGFLLASVFEILIYLGLPLPKKYIYIINLIAGFVLAIGTTMHLDERDMMDYHVHKILAMLVVLLLIAYCYEIYDSDNFWATYGRIYFFFLFGTWLIEIGFVKWPITNNPKFNFVGSNMRDMEIISSTLGFHFLLAAIYFTVLHSLVYYTFPCLNRICIDNEDHQHDNQSFKFDKIFTKAPEYSIIVDDSE